MKGLRLVLLFNGIVFTQYERFTSDRCFFVFKKALLLVVIFPLDFVFDYQLSMCS
ncbi:hypothetical protein AtNW77_Chr1g0069851 [Arabidopsis thaliana]